MLDAAALRDLRREFPALGRLRRGKPPVYLNSTCMTLRPRAVVDAVARYYEEFPTCGGGRAEGARRAANWFGEELWERETAAREALRALVNAERAEEMVWTRNATEALNIVAHGFALAPGDRVVLSEREHNSNLVPWLEAERRLRDRAGDPALRVVETFPLAPDGSFSLPQALALVRPGVKVVSVGHSSNLDGTTVSDADLKALSDAAHRVGAVLVVDGAQSVPHRRVDVRALGIDFLAFSLHKMCGPSGVGALYGRYDLLDALAPFVVGGDTIRDTWHDRVEYKHPPGRFEAGLQDYAGIVGAEAAIEFVAKRVGFDSIGANDLRLNRLLTERVAAVECEHLWMLGPRDPALRGGVLTLTSPLGAVLNAIERIADEESNVMVRKGMFCVNAYLHGRFDATGTARNNLRVSTYLYNTEEEIDAVARVIERVARDPLRHLDDE
jgi:cysteine desulfurase/selenocysteine lyase